MLSKPKRSPTSQVRYTVVILQTLTKDQLFIILHPSLWKFKIICVGLKVITCWSSKSIYLLSYYHPTLGYRCLGIRNHPLEQMGKRFWGAQG